MINKRARDAILWAGYKITYITYITYLKHSVDWAQIDLRCVRRPLSPTPDIPSHTSGAAMCQKETCRSLLNNLVCKSEQIWGEREAKLFCGLLVDDQLKFGGLHNRDVGGFCPL